MMLRTIIQRFFPRLARKIEADSRQWMVQCPDCGHERSVWDAGGIRYKASGTVYRLGKCPECGKRRMMKVYRPE